MKPVVPMSFTFTVKGWPPVLAPGDTMTTGGVENGSSKSRVSHPVAGPVSGNSNAPEVRSTSAWVAVERENSVATVVARIGKRGIEFSVGQDSTAKESI